MPLFQVGLHVLSSTNLLDAPALEPGAVFIPLLEEFTELLSVATWHELFGYVETRAPRFTKNMPASRGKALPLLRTINAFQRFLSHTPQDLKLRGRVQLFASSAIGIADKSAINMRGEYAVITTTWEEQVDEGDVQMEDADGELPGPAISADNHRDQAARLLLDVVVVAKVLCPPTVP